MKGTGMNFLKVNSIRQTSINFKANPVSAGMERAFLNTDRDTLELNIVQKDNFFKNLYKRLKSPLENAAAEKNEDEKMMEFFKDFKIHPPIVNKQEIASFADFILCYPAYKKSAQEAYNRFASDFISAVNTWTQMQKEKRQQLQEQYKREIDNNLIKEEYLNWYESVAEEQQQNIAEKMELLVSHIIPDIGDNHFTGVLDSGSGNELLNLRQTSIPDADSKRESETASQTRHNFKTGLIFQEPLTTEYRTAQAGISPIFSDHITYVEYKPKTTQNSNTADITAKNIQKLLAQRSSIISNIIKLLPNFPQNAEIKKICEEISGENSLTESSKNKLIELYGSKFSSIIDNAFSILFVTEENILPTDIVKELIQNNYDKTKYSQNDVIGNFNLNLKNIMISQQKLQNSVQKLAALESPNNSFKMLFDLFKTLNSQFVEVNQEIKMQLLGKENMLSNSGQTN